MNENTWCLSLHLAYFSEHGDFQFHSCWRKWWDFSFKNGWRAFLYVNIDFPALPSPRQGFMYLRLASWVEDELELRIPLPPLPEYQHWKPALPHPVYALLGTKLRLCVLGMHTTSSPVQRIFLSYGGIWADSHFGCCRSRSLLSFCISSPSAMHPRV